MARSSDNEPLPQDAFASPDLAGEASRLSDKLNAVQGLLSKIPFRIATTISEGQVGLMYARRGGDWILYWLSREDRNDEFEATPLSQATISVKAHAATLLPKLLEVMIHERNKRTRELRDAHAALDRVPALIQQLRTPASGAQAPSSEIEAGFDEVPF